MRANFVSWFLDVVDSSQVYRSWKYFPAEQACSSCWNFILRCWPLTCFRAMLAQTLAMQAWNYWNWADHWSWIRYVAYLDCMKHSCCIRFCNPRDRARRALAGDAWRNQAPFWSLWAGGLSKNEDETNSSTFFEIYHLIWFKYIWGAQVRTFVSVSDSYSILWRLCLFFNLMSLFDTSWANPLPNVLTLGIGRNRQHHGNIMAKHLKQLGHLGVLWLRWYSESSTLQAPSDSPIPLSKSGVFIREVTCRCLARAESSESKVQRQIWFEILCFILDLLEGTHAFQCISCISWNLFCVLPNLCSDSHRGKSFSFLGCSLDSGGENIAERR